MRRIWAKIHWAAATFRNRSNIFGKYILYPRAMWQWWLISHIHHVLNQKFINIHSHQKKRLVKCFVFGCFSSSFRHSGFVSVTQSHWVLFFSRLSPWRVQINAREKSEKVPWSREPHWKKCFGVYFVSVYFFIIIVIPFGEPIKWAQNLWNGIEYYTKRCRDCVSRLRYFILHELNVSENLSFCHLPNNSQRDSASSFRRHRRWPL